MAKVTLRRKVNISLIVSGISTLFIGLWVGGNVLESVVKSMNGTSNPFISAGFASMFGLGTNADGSLDGTISTSSILGIVGVLGGAMIILSFVKVSL